MNTSATSRRARAILGALLLASTLRAQPPQPAPPDTPAESRGQVCREHLLALGNAIALYLRGSSGKLPERLGQLHEQGLVLDLSLFTCPRSGTRIEKPEDIDSLTDYALAPTLGPERPLRLLWEKKPNHAGQALVFLSNRTFELVDAGALPGAGPAEPPTPQQPPAPPTIAPTNPPDRPPTPPAPPLGAGPAAWAKGMDLDNALMPDGRFTPEMWQVEAKPGEPGARIESGRLVLEVAARRDASAWMTGAMPGDFDVRLDYEVAWDPAKLVRPGFGLRLASTPGWKGDLGVSLDRNLDDEGREQIVASLVGPAQNELVAVPSGPRGVLRVTRTGDRFECFTWDAQRAAWMPIGRLTARLSPEVHIGIAAYYLLKGGYRVTIHSMYVGPRLAPP